MQGRVPVWVGAVLAFLALATLRAGRRPVLAEEVLARARAHGVEHDPRRMSVRELRQLPGVGQRLAQVVAEARDAHRGTAPLAWEDVPGIGPKRAAEIRAWCAARGIAAEPLAPGLGPEQVPGYALAMLASARALAWTLVLALAGCREAARESAAGTPAAEPSTRAHVLALSGGALHALEAGPADGPLVLLLHGMRYSARTWEELGTLELLAAHGYRVVALDWPGYGATPAWNGPPDAAALLAAVLAELGDGRVVLVGASMGGGFALELLGQSTAGIAGFVGIAPAGSERFAPGAWDLATLLLWGAEDAVLRPAVGEALARRLGARLEVVPGAGHAAYLDQPERFHALLLEFLALHAPLPASSARQGTRRPRRRGRSRGGPAGPTVLGGWLAASGLAGREG
ncbi:MAG TPA: alpha/beta fold hydrolase [Planctomycetota bacterium]